jgi:hypothetical protein
MLAIGRDVVCLQIQPQRFPRSVLENHQHRQDTVLIRIHLAERGPHLLLAGERHRGDRDLLDRLMSRIRRRRARRKTILVLIVVVVSAPRRYTQKNYPHA